jgi:nanoRNase/pAp phosphatase (c-di-AMP/oligoRNAs hydrolase)
LEGVETAIVFGMVEDGIQLSARSTDTRIHIGNVLDGAFSDVGSAGGHREMAGCEVPLGVFADYTTDDTQLFAIVEQVMSARLIAELNLTAETGTQATTDGEET